VPLIKLVKINYKFETLGNNKKLHKIAKQNMEKQEMVQEIQFEKDESFAPQL
jgi:hypothetical protein